MVNRLRSHLHEYLPGGPGRLPRPRQSRTRFRARSRCPYCCTHPGRGSQAHPRPVECLAQAGRATASWHRGGSRPAEGDLPRGLPPSAPPRHVSLGCRCGPLGRPAHTGSMRRMSVGETAEREGLLAAAVVDAVERTGAYVGSVSFRRSRDRSVIVLAATCRVPPSCWAAGDSSGRLQATGATTVADRRRIPPTLRASYAPHPRVDGSLSDRCEASARP